VSSDLLTWTPDPGIRIGPAARWLTGRANHPTALVNSNGSVTLVYDRNPPGPIEEEMIATSGDGLDFRAEADTGIVGTEPSFARLSDGSLLLYHREQSAASGSLIHVPRC